MEEKTQLYEIVSDLWNAMKFILQDNEPFTEERWEKYINDIERETSKKYKNKPQRYWQLYKRLFIAIEYYLIDRRNGL